MMRAVRRRRVVIKIISLVMRAARRIDMRAINGTFFHHADRNVLVLCRIAWIRMDTHENDLPRPLQLMECLNLPDMMFFHNSLMW